MHEFVYIGFAVEYIHSILLCFPNAMVSTTLSFCGSITDWENSTCGPMSQITVEKHGTIYHITKFILLMRQKNMKVQVNVWVLVLAIDIKHFVVKLVDETYIVLSQMGYPGRGT